MNDPNYEEIDVIEVNGTKYAYLSNPDNPNDFIINKIILKDNKEYYTGLDNENEYDLALMYFMKKYITKK